MLSRHSAALVSAMLMGSLDCAHAAPPAPLAPPAPGLPPLPASFAGVLPCADCEGIRYELDLRPGEVYFLRLTYLGKGEAAVFDDVGQWSLMDTEPVLVLRGGGEAPGFFSISSPERLRKRDIEGHEIVSSLPYELERTEPYAPLVPRLRLRGMYAYLADAAWFEECLTGLRLPVAMEADNAALERAYGALQREPGQPVLAIVEGTIEPRPRRDGEGKVESLVPLRFERFWPGETCGARGVTSGLVGTRWVLVRLGEQPVVVTDGSREPHLVLTQDGRVQGSGGCNRLLGGYLLEGASLELTQLAATRMFCPEGMETEAAFTAALTAARTWKILGSHLELYGEDGALVARLEARELE